MEGAVEGRTDDGGQVVTRYPYENVGMDHLLSKEKEVNNLHVCFCLTLKEQQVLSEKIVL